MATSSEAKRIESPTTNQPNLLRHLHFMSKTIKKQADFSILLQKTVDLLPSAFRYPDSIIATITVESASYHSSSPRRHHVTNRHRAPIFVDDVELGTVDVGYIAFSSDDHAPDFLPEEQCLVLLIAEHIADVITLKTVRNQACCQERRLRALASELTRTEEKQRRSLALALHDRLGQSLALSKLHLELLRSSMPKEHQSQVDKVVGLIMEAIETTKDLTLEVSPPLVYELGLEQALIWLGERLKQRAGLNVIVQSKGNAEPSENARIMLFRSVQELLMNVVKHAHTNTARVILSFHAHETQVAVEDDGVGFDMRQQSSPLGFGLFSIRERIHHLGGRMDVNSSCGDGTSIYLSLPRHADAKE